MSSGAEGEGVGALQGFVACAKSAKGQALTHWIKEAISHPHIFVFGELLDLPNVKALRESDDAVLKSWHKLLTIFSSGTYRDYQTSLADGSVPKLEAKELHKLKQLTLVSMAAKERSLAYDDIMSAIDINDVRQLEDLVIEIITNDLIKAKLDQQHRKVEVQDAVARDVGEDDIARMLATLDAWSLRATAVISSLNDIEKQANQTFTQRQDARADREKRASDMRGKVKKEIVEETPKFPSRFGGDEEDYGYGMMREMNPSPSQRGRATRSSGSGGGLFDGMKKGFMKQGLFG